MPVNSEHMFGIACNSSMPMFSALSLIELEHHPDDRVQFNGFFSVTEYQRHLINAHESFKYLLQELEEYEFARTFEIMRVLRLKIDELEALFDPAHEELGTLPRRERY